VSRTSRLAIVLVLNLVLVAGLIAVGITAHSLGVLAEGVDYIADAAAIGVSLFAIWLANRPVTDSRPQGYHRATDVAAMVNVGWLLALSVLVAVGAVTRLASGVQQVHGLPVLVVSGIAALVMLGGAFILRGDAADDGPDDRDLNVRAVLLDTAADAAAASGVAVTGGIILATGGFYWLDPTVALLIAAVVTVHAVRLLNDIVRSFRSEHLA
jgi:cobalt-zinc-cadmium efflux system protein